MKYLLFSSPPGLCTKTAYMGWKLGADDYITKPFSTQELYLGINAILRKGPKIKPGCRIR